MAANMNTSLQKYPIPDQVQDWILDELWKPCTPDAEATAGLNLAAYFSYYSSRCRHFSHDGCIHISAKSHADLVSISQRILADATREEVCSSLGSPPNDADADRSRTTNTTVDLCASLLLMAEVGMHKFGFSGSTPLTWSGPQTLRQAIEQRFQPETDLQPDNPRVGRLFTARNLSYIGGIKIKWTNNIVDHLLLSDDDQAVFIYHHVGFLRFQQGLKNPLFSNILVDETLRSLALLFPQNDRKSRRWLLNQISEHSLDPSLARCGNLRVQDRRFEHFSFWRDRLIILKQAFDESTPPGITQWWHDRRNSVQWCTFWVAILVFVMTVFFGLVQSIEGAMQVYLSWKALYEPPPP